MRSGRFKARMMTLAAAGAQTQSFGLRDRAKFSMRIRADIWATDHRLPAMSGISDCDKLKACGAKLLAPSNMAAWCCCSAFGISRGIICVRALFCVIVCARLRVAMREQCLCTENECGGP